MRDVVLREDRDGWTILRINRPEKRNALNMDVFVALDHHLAALEQETETIGVVVLTGTPDLFSAGADLGRQQRGPEPHFQGKTIERLSLLPQPVIAAVRGICLAGAIELALGADLIFASETAIFADTHAKWALVPGWGLSKRLPRRIGTHRARAMSFTGRQYDGRSAERIGLVDFCVADDVFGVELDRLVSDLLAQSWHSLRGYKRLYNETEDLSLAAGLAHETDNSPGLGADFAARVSGRFGRHR